MPFKSYSIAVDEKDNFYFILENWCSVMNWLMWFFWYNHIPGHLVDDRSFVKWLDFMLYICLLQNSQIIKQKKMQTKVLILKISAFI